MFGVWGAGGGDGMGVEEEFKGSIQGVIQGVRVLEIPRTLIP